MNTIYMTEFQKDQHFQVNFDSTNIHVINEISINEKLVLKRMETIN